MELLHKPIDIFFAIFRENQVNTMVADAQAPCGAWSSASMVLTTKAKCFTFFHKKYFNYLHHLRPKKWYNKSFQEEANTPEA